jgi:hypothetical protein
MDLLQARMPAFFLILLLYLQRLVCCWSKRVAEHFNDEQVGDRDELQLYNNLHDTEDSHAMHSLIYSQSLHKIDDIIYRMSKCQPNFLIIKKPCAPIINDIVKVVKMVVWCAEEV